MALASFMRVNIELRRVSSLLTPLSQNLHRMSTLIGHIRDLLTETHASCKQRPFRRRTSIRISNTYRYKLTRLPADARSFSTSEKGRECERTEANKSVTIRVLVTSWNEGKLDNALDRGHTSPYPINVSTIPAAVSKAPSPDSPRRLTDERE